MEQQRSHALSEFLKVVPEKIRAEGAQFRESFEVSDQGDGVIAKLQTPEEPLELRFDFHPTAFNITGAYCSCREARRGRICAHLCGLAGRIINDYLSRNTHEQSLEFLDKHFKTPAFEHAQFRLSIEIVEGSEGLEPEIMFHKTIKEGSYGVGRKFTANDSYKFTHGEPADQNLLDYIKHFRQIVFYSNYDLNRRFPWGFWLTLQNHPRVSCQDHPLRVRAAEIDLVLNGEDDSYHLEIEHDGRPLDDLKYFQVEGGMLGFSRRHGELLVCQTSQFRANILMDVFAQKPTLTRTEVLANLPRLEKLQRVFHISLPAELEGLIQRIKPELVLILDLDVQRGFTLSPRIRYEGSEARLTPGSQGQYLSTEDQSVVERDQTAELEQYEAFLNHFPYEEEPNKDYQILVPDLSRAMVILDWLKQQNHSALEWRREEPKIQKAGAIQGLRVQIDSKAWLKLHLMTNNRTFSMPYFPEEDHALAGSSFVAVGEGEWLEIDDSLRQQLNRLKMAVAQEDQRMQLKNAALAVLAEMENVTWEGDDTWLQKIREWRGETEQPITAPEGLQADLRNYQLDGYRWLRRLSELGVGACLADDMGLGKTVQALAVLFDRMEHGPVLVVAPASVCFNWREEITRFAPSLKPILYAEGRRNRGLSRLKKGDIVILSYALVLKDIKKLKEVHWGALILDEAQFVKNALSQTAIAVSQLSRAWTLALTGTPLENHLGELWSIFRMLNPELLGSWEHFRKTYVAPIEREKDVQKLDNLRRLIQPFILRRTKKDVLDDLPDRSDILLKVELGEAQRAKYEQERKRILSQLDESDETIRFKLLAAITRLRQLACHPGLCEEKYKGESAKLRLFTELVEELVSEEHRVLVFSQFTSFLGLIARELNRIHLPHLMMTGETPVKHRKTIIDRFQNDEAPVFLVSLRAGGTGLNLTNANYVIHMDPWWNPAVEEQATDRAHRIGQTRAVTVYRLVATNTIEESIIDIHSRKRDLVEGILEGKDQVGKLSITDLISLIRGDLDVDA